MEGKYRTDDAFIESFFQKGDLLPAIVQEVGTNEVLMLAYMNRESMKDVGNGLYLVLQPFPAGALE